MRPRRSNVLYIIARFRERVHSISTLILISHGRKRRDENNKRERKGGAVIVGLIQYYHIIHHFSKIDQ